MSSATSAASPPCREYHADKMSECELIANRVDMAVEAALYILNDWNGIERGLQALLQIHPQGMFASIYAPEIKIHPKLLAFIHAPIHLGRTKTPQATGGIDTASQRMPGAGGVYDPAFIAAKRKFLLDGYKRAERVLMDVHNEDARSSLAVWLAKFNCEEDQLWIPDGHAPPRMPEPNARGSDFLSQDEATQAAVMSADLLTPHVITISRPDWGTITDARVINSRTLPEEHDRKCPICWDGLEEEGHGQAVQLDCGHVFGEACIGHWFEESYSCPMCRDEKCEAY